MSANSRLTIAVHALTWLALAHTRGHERLTSDEVAASVNTNPVILRRSLGDLHRAGLVDVRRGAGAGWRLTREPEMITLLDVYTAVSPGPLFAMHRTAPNLECPVGYGIRPTLKAVYDDVETSVRATLARRTVADLLAQTMEAHRERV